MSVQTPMGLSMTTIHINQPNQLITPVITPLDDHPVGIPLAITLTATITLGKASTTLTDIRTNSESYPDS